MEKISCNLRERLGDELSSKLILRIRKDRVVSRGELEEFGKDAILIYFFELYDKDVGLVAKNLMDYNVPKVLKE